MACGDVFAGGHIAGPAGDPDVAVLRLHGRSGRERWRASFSLPISARFDVVEQILAHPSGDVVAIMDLAAEDGPDVVRVLRLDGRNRAVRWQRDVRVGGCFHARLGRDLLMTLVRGDRGLIVGGGITNDDDLDPFEGVVVSRDCRRGTDAQGSQAHGAHGHVPPGHRVP